MKKMILAAIIYVFMIIVVIPYFIVRFMPAQGNTVQVYITDEDRVEEMDINQYLKEVVGAEMPATFADEALKAQAVAARTYLCSKMMSEPVPEHKGAAVCTDYRHCKAWMSEEKRKEAWDKDNRDGYWKKISDAVNSTKGEILTYDGKPISAVFHSTSSGRTENSEDVWGEALPYLRSVESRGDELSPKYYSEFRCTEDEFKRVVSENTDNADGNSMLFSDIERSEGGGIKKINLCGVTIKGTEFRSMFNLRSTNVEISQAENDIIMTVKGNGHGVGMSQYGAEFMANNGSGYEEILKYYYTGVSLDKNDAM